MRGSANRFSEEQKSEIIKIYTTQDISVGKLSKMFPFSKRGILCMLRNNNVVIRNSYSETNRKYTLNQHYFDKIDSEEKAYFLGFLYADGCNCQHVGLTSMSLQECDKLILERFAKAIGSNRPIRFIKARGRRISKPVYS